MAEFKFVIPNEKIDDVIEAMAGLYLIPKNEDGSNKFTEGQWAREVVRKFIVQQVARWKQIKAQRQIAFVEDDTLVS